MPKQTFFNLPDDKRKWILNCAVREFAERGYPGACISRIVSEAKIAKGSFYQYFEDKEDLYAYIIDHTIVMPKIRISNEESEKLEYLSLTEFLREMFKSMVREFEDKPELLKIGLDHAKNRNEPVQTRITAKYRSFNETYFQNFIREEKSRGELDKSVDDDILSLMLHGAANAVTNILLTKGHDAITEEFIDEWVDKLEYILTNGIYKNTTHIRNDEKD